MRPRVSSDFGPALCIPIVRSGTASRNRNFSKAASQFLIAHEPRDGGAVLRKSRVRLARQWREQRACQPVGPMPVMPERIKAHNPGVVAHPNRAPVADNQQLLRRAGGQARIQPGGVRRLRRYRTEWNQRRLRRKPVCKAPAEPAPRIVKDEQASHVRPGAL